MSSYVETMERVKRERETETEVRKLDSDDITQWVHRLEDQLSDSESAADELGELLERCRQQLDWLDDEHPLMVDIRVCQSQARGES